MSLQERHCYIVFSDLKGMFFHILFNEQFKKKEIVIVLSFWQKDKSERLRKDFTVFCAIYTLEIFCFTFLLNLYTN